MKIKTKTLTTFLKKSKMDGQQAISECILRFEKDGLKINANSASKQARMMGWLLKDNFKEYEEMGNVGINDFEGIIKVLERFGEMIALKKEGNLLTVSGDNKKVDIELVAENFLDTDTGEPTLDFKETFSITASKLKDIFKDVQMNKDATLTISTEDKKVIFSNTGKYKFNNQLGAPTCKGGESSTYGEPFIDATMNLDGTLDVSMSSNYPIKVREKLETSVISIIIAPRVDEE